MPGVALALGSSRALVVATLTGVVVVARTALEDRTLRAELAGYEDYASRVRYRLLPGIW
jgi:protein-S-isoprenylcysteine O-methyltransferase Ste14